MTSASPSATPPTSTATKPSTTASSGSPRGPRHETNSSPASPAASRRAPQPRDAHPRPGPGPPAAPLPSAITAATKLFLGNAGDQENADCLRAYNDVYAGITALHRFQLLPDPSTVDLVLELHYEIALGQAVGSNDRDTRQFRLVLLDPHTRTVLWSITERTNYAVRQNNRNRNLDETVTKLVADFASLTTAQPPNNNSRVPHPHFP